MFRDPVLCLLLPQYWDRQPGAMSPVCPQALWQEKDSFSFLDLNVFP